MADTIKTYPQLGRFIMSKVYNILLNSKDYKIEYKELKRLIRKKIDENPQIDKKFAIHELQHGSSKSYLSTYRWENVLYYYLIQHFKCSFTDFEYWEDKQEGIHDYIRLRTDYLLDPKCHYSKKFRIQPDMNYMFDWAQQLNKNAEEKLLQQMNNQLLDESYRGLAEWRLIKDESILSNRNYIKTRGGN